MFDYFAHFFLFSFFIRSGSCIIIYFFFGGGGGRGPAWLQEPPIFDIFGSGQIPAPLPTPTFEHVIFTKTQLPIVVLFKSVTFLSLLLF